MNESSGPNKALVAIIVVVLVGLVAGGAYLLTKPSDDQDNMTSSQTSDQTTANSPSTKDTPAATDGTYTDGTYEATGSYNSPGGRESVKVSLTIANNKVMNSTVTSEAKNPTAKGYQSDFISGYKTFVNGKSVDEIKLDTVAGSSLTPKGFEDALEQIKKDATA
jgi:uncharacterized protein with FMN-binding domain